MVPDASNRSTSIRSCCAGAAASPLTPWSCLPTRGREGPMLRVERLSKIFENVTDQIVGGVRDASFELEAGTFFTLLGPSGCGKTTTLRCIAGLETPDSGIIAVDDRRLFDAKARINVPVEERAVGMVFQSYAIWPHMTVAQNVAFPLTVAKGSKRSKRAEPKRLPSKIGIPTVYVTHDQSEALALSDRIAVMDRGRISQIGSPQEIYFRPANPFVARFVGATNLLPGRLLATSDGRGQVEVLSGRKIHCVVPQPIADPAISVSIRPESIRLALQPLAGEGGDNCLAGRISGG